MRIVHVFAHNDDELGAWPLIRRYVAEGAKQTFLYMTACGDCDVPEIRQRETIRTLQACGVAAPDCRFIGREHAIPTYRLHEHLTRARDLLAEVVLPLAPDVLISHAWEGGHVDHDCSHALTVWLMMQAASAPAAYQFSLYNMRGLRWPLFRGSNPIPENGPLIKQQMSTREWMRFIAAARYHPSQLRALAPLWPSMMLTFGLRHGYHYQAIKPNRVRQRPHEGPLMYEQTGVAVYYSDLRSRLMDALS